MDKKKKDSPERPRAALPEMRELTYNDHKILIPTDEQNKRISVDGRTVYYALNARGEYYLDKYPYNPAKSLDEVIKRYVTHLDAAAKMRKEGK